MRQTSNEKIDPLIRIQEEIAEVYRREEEYRQSASVSVSSVLDEHIERETKETNVDDRQIIFTKTQKDMGVLCDTNLVNGLFQNTFSHLQHTDNKENNCLYENHPNSYEGFISQSEHFVASKNTSTTELFSDTFSSCGKEQRYIGPNCYNIVPTPPQQKIILQTVPIPTLLLTKQRQFSVNPGQKGVMQRFLASHGKPQCHSSEPKSLLLEKKECISNMETNDSFSIMQLHNPNIGLTAVPPLISFNRSAVILPPTALITSSIERDLDGKPIRPGYVPVELKIQRELNDLRTRETELKEIRKMRQSTSDLLDSNKYDNCEIDNFETERCLVPGKLRLAKSIDELDGSTKLTKGSCGIKPAMSLAELCDVDPEHAPSSYRLIAQWENLIQQNA